MSNETTDYRISIGNPQEDYIDGFTDGYSRGWQECWDYLYKFLGGTTKIEQKETPEQIEMK